MSKTQYFSNTFSKIAKRWSSSPPALLKSSILVTWSSVILAKL